MVHKVQVSILLLLIPFGLLYFYAEHRGETIGETLDVFLPVMYIDDIPVRVEVADTHELRVQGLSGRIGISGGMFFIFDTADHHSMWMKDMLFPIDIIWIDAQYRVVGVEKNIWPDTYPEKFSAPVPARFALETEANFAHIYGINVGDTVRLPKEIERLIKSDSL